MQLDFRAPGRELPLARLLQRALPEADLQELLRRGAVDVAGLRRLRPETAVPAGSRVRVTWDGADPQAELAGRTAGVWRALVPAVPWHRGEFEATRKLPGGWRFERVETRTGLSELLLRGTELAASRLMEQLAAFGHPVLGDLRRGGITVEGGLRLEAALDDGAFPLDRAGWWPEEAPLLCTGTPRFGVSAATLRALARQHPWVLRDAETDDASRFAAGTLVRIEAGGAETDVLARVEDGGRLAARVWARRGGGSRSSSVEERVAQALERREALLRPVEAAAATDAFRLIHGEADALPGIAIDRLGPVLRVLLTGRAAESIATRALDCVCHSLADLLGPDPPVVEVVHLRDRPPGRLECVRMLRGSLPTERGVEAAQGSQEGERLPVRERGIAFWVDPGLAQPEKPSPGVGLYLDQRTNRERLARHARRGGRWLNLFAHTGAFSLALLDAGADEVISVDLSARVLRWLEANLALNPDLDAARHGVVRADGRHYLGAPARGRSAEPFDGIVIDPPTAAAGGRGYWKLERDLPPLVEAALRRLAPGGSLFVSRNDRRRRHSAGELVRAAAQAAGVAIEAPRSAPPGPDFPRLQGFPEGDSFDAAITRRRR